MNCDCNNYSLLTANTGIVTISYVNPYLDGTGTMGSVITAAANGTTVRSVVIKAIAPVSDGMVRLFIKRPVGPSSFVIDLYREVIITETPQAPIVPVPTPQYTMFEAVLLGDLQLKSGESLVASTQNADTFNIIVEGIDWIYPATTPDVCCNFEQIAAATGNGTVSIANSALDGSGTIENIFTADTFANGATITRVTIKALQSTYEGVVRLFISPDGRAWSLMQEVWIPQTTQSAFEPSFKHVVDMNFKLEAGYSIGASTQNAESFALTVEALDWTYPATTEILSRTVTIDHTQCGSSDSTDFPVLVSIQDDTLKTAANGGHVANANGYDILFFSDSGETTLLTWEVEFYDGAAGTLVVWVLIPTVSHTTDTVFYMQYGDSSITTFQGGAAGSVWDSNYLAVYHFPDGTTLSAADATANANDGTITAATAVAGMIDGAASFDGSTSRINLNAKLFGSLAAGTFETWANPSSLPAGYAAMCYEDGGGHNAFVIQFNGASSPINANLGSNTSIDSATSSWSVNTWYHIVFTFDGTNVIFYINGALDVSYTNSSIPGTSVNNTNLGSVFDPAYFDFYSGILDELRISDIARTANWITTEYNNQSNPGNIGVAGFITYGNEI